MRKTPSYAPKLYTDMNAYLHSFLSSVEAVFHPSAGKSNGQKEKRRTGKTSFPPQASPDCLHLRAGLRTQNSVRRNPAP